MAYIEWWNRTGPITLGERFGLNEISTARNTLSPIKSHTAESLLPSQFDEIYLEEMEDIKKQVKFGEQVKDGGRIDMKPGGIVEPGVENYAKFASGDVPHNKVEFTSSQIKKIKELRNKGYSLNKIAETLKIEGAASGTAYRRLNLPSIDEAKRIRIRELVKTKEYTQAEIINIVEKQFGTTTRDSTVRAIAKQEKITLPKGSGMAFSEKYSEVRSVYLKNYTFDDLAKDIKAGKTRIEIAENLINKNKKYYDTLKLPKNLSLRAAVLAAVNDRLIKRPELYKVEQKFIKQALTDKKNALKDIRNFINKNKSAYIKVYASNKIGAIDSFKEKILDYASQKYPDLVVRSKGGENILSGQRIFTGYEVIGRDITQMGEYGRDIGLNKDIRKALGIPERPGKGEGEIKDRLTRSYNRNTLQLLKVAQEKDLVPKIDPITKNLINSEDAYYRYVNRTQIDPIRNLFAKKFKFGQEHVGGIARAARINDPVSLTKITAMDPFQNKYVKGIQYDTKVSNLMDLAKQSSTEKAKGYIESVNKLIAESDKKFGLDQTKYKVVGNEIIPVHPKATLKDTLYKKAQRALKTFVATKRFKDPNFKLLPEELKKAINFLKEGNVLKSNAFLKAAIKRGGAASVILLGTGIALNTLTDSAEAKTLEPSDKKQEAGISATDVGKGTLATATGYAVTHPKQAWELAKKYVGKPVDKIIAPLLTPAISIAAHGKPDVTSGLEWITPAFWNAMTKRFGLTGTIEAFKKAPSAAAKTKLAIDMLLRAGIPMKLLPIISAGATTVAGPLLVSDAAKALQKRIDKKGLTGIIEEQSGMIGDEAGASLFMEDVWKEKKRRDAEGMDYATGGIASLIK